jgi:CheY-like chemotaxis protein
MVQGFAEQSGGRLRLTSEPGVGTIAEIWLPAVDDYKAELAKPSQSAAAPQTDKLIVLAVDDDALVLMGTAAMLEDLGHEVREATSGEQALRLLQKGERIDLVVTDQAMPRMTGLELAQAIKALRPNLPIILATGYAELPGGLSDGLMKLSKPFTQNQLATAMKQVLP